MDHRHHMMKKLIGAAEFHLGGFYSLCLSTLGGEADFHVRSDVFSSSFAGIRREFVEKD